MRGNKLWDGHRIVLPEMREKAVHRCRECRFLAVIVGQEETRSGCVAGIASFGGLMRQERPARYFNRVQPRMPRPVDGFCRA